MAGTSGRQTTPVSQQLLQEPYRFDFFQAVRLLEQMARVAAPAEPGSASDPTSDLDAIDEAGPVSQAAAAYVGEDGSPATEAVRFRSQLALSFSGGQIAEIRRPATDAESLPSAPYEMVVSFLGLTGPAGVLPAHYTRLLIERTRSKDLGLRDFLDLFHHRLLSLFYRAWEKYRFPVGYERAATEQAGEDLFTRALYALVGLGTNSLRHRRKFDDEVFIRFGGGFTRATPTAVMLEQMLQAFLEQPVRLLQFQGQWLRLEPEDQSIARVGQNAGSSQNCTLGQNVILGERVWNVYSKFRVCLGPLNYADFCRFLPNGDRLQACCQLVQTYVGQEFDFDIRLELKAEEIPVCQLGGTGGASRLGWNTWIHSRAAQQNSTDAVMRGT